MSDATVIRDATTGDAAAVAAIYNVHVRTTIVTFEVAEVGVAGMAARIAATQADGLPWLVVEDAGSVVGYACASRWKARAAYARTAETSIYLAGHALGRGLGKRLYAALIARLRDIGMHALIGGAALPNPASAALHEALGFRHVGTFREVGYKLGRWIDVGYWQLELETGCAQR